jgi:glycosyltransferase involved in cell wall biosynthesis
MNIVHLDSHLSWRGGEQQVLFLTRFLHAHGHHSVVMCPPHSALYQRLQEAGLPCYALPIRHEFDVLAAWRLEGYLRRQQVDILHMHAAHAHTIGILAGLRMPQVHKVVSRRVDFPPLRNHFSRWKYLWPQVQYLTVSEAIRQILLTAGVPPGRVQTIYSGIDLQRFDNLSMVPSLFPAGTRVVGSVGHLAGHKGHRYLLEALPYIRQTEPNIRLMIVGEGELRSALEAQAAALGVTEQVCFTGFRHDVVALMQQFEVFVHPSYLEGLGTVLLDAMALGKPVVATHAGGIPEVVQDGVTGLLVPPRDPPALARAVLHLLRHPEYSMKFGAAGRQRVEQGFTAAHTGALTLQVYQQLLANRQSAAAPGNRQR